MNTALLTLLPLVLPLYAVRFHIGPLPTTLLEVALLLMLTVWTSQRRTAGWHDALGLLKRHGWLLPLGLWLVAGAIGVAVAPDHVGALGLWRAYFLEPVLVFVMLTDLVRTDTDRTTLIRSLVIVNVILAVWAIAQAVGILPIPSPWDVPPSGIRATGPFPYPNALALFSVPIAALCISLLSKKTRAPGRMVILLWFGFVSGLVAALMAKSDGGLIALATAVFVALILRKTTRFPTVVTTALLGIVLLVVPATRTIIADQILFREWSGKVRLVMWDETVTMLRDRPLFGAGLGAYPDVIAPYHEATWMEVFQYPHDILLNLWSETGLLGIVAFAWLLILWWRRGRSLALPVIAALVVHGLVDVPYFKNDLAVMFWLLVVVTALTRPKESDTLRPQTNSGEVAEWSKAPDSKSGVPARVP